MLAKRIIPCLDVKDGRVVKGVNFLELRDAGDPVEQAQVYDREGADELVFLDITASHERRDIVIDMVRRVADSVFIPFTVGGGIRTVDDMRGAAAGRRRQGLDQLAGRAHARADHRRGDALRQPVHRRGDRRQADGRPLGGVHRRRPGADRAGGRRVGAARSKQLGAGEILLTSMDTDGTQAGYDLPMLRAVSSAVSIPVIASGGAGALPHFYDALTAGGADAALAASLFHYRQLSVGEVKAYLAERGVPVRFLVEG